MDRLFANGTVNAAQTGQGPTLFLFHSLLSDRASFDAIAPDLARSHRTIVPELPGFGKSAAVDGGLAEVADRMAEAVTDAANEAMLPCSETAMAGSSRCKWRFVIPRSQAGLFLPIAARRFRKPVARLFAT